MDKRNRTSRRVRTSTFHPDDISTRVHQAICRDLHPLTQVYEGIGGPLQYLALRQCAEFLKKFNAIGSDQEKLEREAFEKFTKVNKHMRKARQFAFPRPTQRVQSNLCTEEKILLRARALVHFVLGELSEDEWFRGCKNSSGASLGVSFTDTSPEAKLKLPLTSTKRASFLFDRYLSWDPHLKAAVLALNSEFPKSERYQIVEGSRATTVDKTSIERRMIAIEPTANMFLQQGLMAVMYRRLRKVGLDVQCLPTIHRQKAKESSITGKYATIDWSSASDCVSIELLRWLLPAQWFSCIDAVRSTQMTLNGSLVSLNMFATMGNATTFPVETLVFWSFAHAAKLTLADDSNTLFPEWEDLGDCLVFGDDCIVPSEVAPLFIRALTSVGFLVNNNKTFMGSTKFRESCGGDFLAGYDVRPFFLKAPTSTRRSALEPWLHIIVNSIIPKYISCFGGLAYVYDKALFRLLGRLCDEYGIRFCLVPDYYPDDAGLKVSSDILRLSRHYPRIKFERVTIDKHGSIHFRYRRFNYRQHLACFDQLHYAIWLKNPRVSSSEPMHQRIIRRIGGYMVAKGVSSHWEVPGLEPRR